MTSHREPPRRNGSRAAALRYDRGRDRAPRLVARGHGAVADRIRALAREHGVPIQSDPTLVALLDAVDLGDEIPPALFAAVAEIIGLIWRLDSERP